jgi:hypothetical protein
MSNVLIYLTDSCDLSTSNHPPILPENKVEKFSVWSAPNNSQEPILVGNVVFEKTLKRWFFVSESGYAFSKMYMSRIFSLLGHQLDV